MAHRSVGRTHAALGDPGVVISPEALLALNRGFDRLAALLALTLGPNQGVVINARNGKGDPELLVDTATIVKRVIELPNRAENVGAMLIRAMVQDMHQRYGDGAATAGVLGAAMLHEACVLISAGANPMLLRRGLDRGVSAAVAALEAQSRPVDGREQLHQIALAATGDADLSTVLGEMFDLLGPDGALVVHEFYAPYLEREYLDGGRWTGRPAARRFLPEGQPELALENPLILAVDQPLTSLDHVRPLLELALSQGTQRPVLIVCHEAKGDALNTMLLNLNRGTLNVNAFVPTAGLLPMEDELADLALLTGGRRLSPAEGWLPARTRPSDFGQARQVTLTREALTVIGGAGDMAERQKRIGELRARLRQTQRDAKDWERLRFRIGRLAGGVGILKIGAYSERERALRKELAMQAVRTLDLVHEAGVVPGGGVAYLECRAAVAAEAQRCSDDDEARGVALVARALEAPFAQLVRNAGEHPPLVLAEAQRLGPGHGFDVRTGRYVHMRDAGLLDCTSVVCGALQAAGSAAGIALTTDIIVMRDA